MGIRIKSTLPNDAELMKLFGSVDMLRRHDVGGATTRAGAKIVLDRARQLAPVGNPEDAAKRSAKQKAQANWNIKLKSTIAMATRGRGLRVFTLVGPRHPSGNKAYFNQPKKGSRLHVLWGKRGGMRTKVVTRVWIVQAFDETRQQQLSAMKAKLTEKINEMLT